MYNGSYPLYYLSLSLSSHLLLCREYAKSNPRPFSIRYDAYTQSVEVINDMASVQKLVDDIKYDVDTLQHSLRKINKPS